MADSVSGNIYAISTEAQVMAQRNAQLGNIFGSVDVKSSMYMYAGDGDEVLQTIENEIEGNRATGDGKNKSMLDWNKYITSDTDSDSILSMGTSGNLTSIDFTTGQVSVQSEYDFARERGLISDDAGKVYDILLFGQNNAQFVNYTFNATGTSTTDIGWNISSMNSTLPWGNMQYILSRNVNPDYWGRIDYDNKDSVASNTSLGDMINNISQWMTAEGYAELDGLTAYSTEWYNKVCELAVRAMDETGSYTWES